MADGDSRGGAEGTAKTFLGRAAASGRAVLRSFPTSVPLATICEPFLFAERWAELASREGDFETDESASLLASESGSETPAWLPKLSPERSG
jgi:hypothetical protein